MKNLIPFLAFVVVIVACQDDFDESKFLSEKAERDSLALMALDELNKKGELVQLTVTINENNSPIQDVQVTLTDGRNEPVSLQTNSDGVVVFDKVTTGASTLSLSKSEYVSATAHLDVTYEPIRDAQGNIIPAKIHEGVVLSVFSTGASTSNTATIKGRVTIETDLTNTTSEVPQDIVLRADLSAMGMNRASTKNTEIILYTFDEGTIGIAEVDNTTGDYEMIVPASVPNGSVTIFYPTISQNQKMAFRHLDGVEVQPQVRSDIPAFFGPALAYDNLPVVPGARVVVNPEAPPAQGSGLTFDFHPHPRDLGLWTMPAGPGASITGDFTPPFEGSPLSNTNVTYSLRNRGSYTASAQIEFGSGANKAVATTSLRGRVTSITTTGGSGYTPNSPVTCTVYFTNSNNTTRRTITNFTVTTTATGSLPTNIPLPQGFAFDPASPFRTLSFVDGYFVTGFGASFSVTPANPAVPTVTVEAEVDGIKMIQAGKDFITAPSISILHNGGSGLDLAITKFKTQWRIEITNNGANYALAPRWLDFFADGSWSTQTVDKYGNFIDFPLNLVRVVNGQIRFSDPNNSYRTVRYSETEPVAQVEFSDSRPARFEVEIESDINQPDFGQVRALPMLDEGAGYHTPFTISVVPSVSNAPGSGAIAQPTFINQTWGEFVYSFSIMVNGGNGYLPNVNRVKEKDNLSLDPSPLTFSGRTTPIAVRPGQTIINNVRYGTGKRVGNFTAGSGGV